MKNILWSILSMKKLTEKLASGALSSKNYYLNIGTKCFLFKASYYLSLAHKFFDFGNDCFKLLDIIGSSIKVSIGFARITQRD